jgi:hypothetical protein
MMRETPVQDVSIIETAKPFLFVSGNPSVRGDPPLVLSMSLMTGLMAGKIIPTENLTPNNAKDAATDRQMVRVLTL